MGLLGSTSDADLTPIIAQIISIIAMSINVLSFQCKNQTRLLIWRMTGSVFFSISYLLLGASMGAMMNVIGIFMSFVFAYKSFFRSDKRIWIYIFVFLYVIVYILTFTVFGKAPSPQNLAIELLPVVATIIITISFSKTNSKHVRYLALISSPMWLTYNIICVSMGGILCESFALISIIIGIFRHDIKKKHD